MDKVKNADHFARVYAHLNETERSEFSRIANKLLSSSFLCAQRDIDRNDYYEALQRISLYRDYFSVLDYEVISYSHEQVIQLKSTEKYNHLNLKLNESVVLLLLRKLYFQKSKEMNVCMDKNNYYMMHQISDFSKARAIKINFNYCHISISKNGGLIAICKKKSFFDKPDCWYIFDKNSLKDIFKVYIITSFKGKTKSEITTLCKSIGITCNFTYSSDYSSTAKDICTSQSKTGKINKGSSITVTLSNGPAKTYTIVIDANQLSSGNPSQTKATLEKKLKSACPGVNFTFKLQKANNGIGYLAKESEVKIGQNKLTQGKTYTVIINSN